jgi:hypothetical protein
MFAKHDIYTKELVSALLDEHENEATIFALGLYAKMLRQQIVYADCQQLDHLTGQMKFAQNMAAVLHYGKPEVFMGSEATICDVALWQLIGHQRLLLSTGMTSSPYGDLESIERHAATAREMYDVEPVVIEA